MTFTPKTKKLLITGIVLLLFIVTNPSIYAFKAFRGRNTYSGLKRPVNFFVASIYKEGSYEFLGLFGNFIDITKSESQINNVHIENNLLHRDTMSIETVGRYVPVDDELLPPPPKRK